MSSLVCLDTCSARGRAITARLAAYLLVAWCAGCDPEGDGVQEGVDGGPDAGEVDEDPDAGETDEYFQCPPRFLSDPDPPTVVHPLQAYCDGEIDCPSGADEDGCPEHFVCRGPRMKVLPESARCDGRVDCYADSDEADCPDQLLCWGGGVNDSYVVGAEKFCDGVVDCSQPQTDGLPPAADERDCADWFLCTVGQTDGPPGYRALAQERVCDGTWDCPTDELDCPGENRFTCADGRTIDRRYLCDQYPHCLDWSDEATSACPEQFPCRWSHSVYPPDQFICSGECGPRFIPAEKACDGTVDCKEGEDEATCLLVPCSSTSPLYVLRQKICNGTADCPGAEDEADCPG